MDPTRLQDVLGASKNLVGFEHDVQNNAADGPHGGLEGLCHVWPESASEAQTSGRDGSVPVWSSAGEPSSRCLREVPFFVCARVTTLILGPTAQRTLVVNFAHGTDRVRILFVECLTALPNLHTLEITSMWDHNVQVFVTALEDRKVRLQLQRVQALVLPAEAHRLLQYCPNIEDLTCCATAPNEAFAESLMAGGLSRITKLSVLSPGRGVIWSSGKIWSSRVYFVSCLLTIGEVNS